MDIERTSYGQIYFVARLEEEGVGSVDSVDEVPDGGTVIIRSHGVGPEVYEKAEKRPIRLVDATCPHVKKAQKAGFVDEHYQPLISRTQAAVLAHAMAQILGIKNKWKVFETLWKRKGMYRDYYQALDQKQSLVFQNKIKELLY